MPWINYSEGRPVTGDMYGSERFSVAGSTAERLANQDPHAIHPYPTLAHPLSKPRLWSQHALGLPPNPAHRETVAVRNIFVRGVPVAVFRYE
jgi:hypothetical protein